MHACLQILIAAKAQTNANQVQKARGNQTKIKPIRRNVAMIDQNNVNNGMNINIDPNSTEFIDCVGDDGYESAASSASAMSNDNIECNDKDFELEGIDTVKKKIGNSNDTATAAIPKITKRDSSHRRAGASM